ncbi:uroporphyrinogen-III synthase [Yoonia maricola]|nr:uroporphyrinogen-III synthase [Yoonia maricola]
MMPTVILTRPKAQSESFAAELRAGWDGPPVDIIVSPLIEIVSVKVTCPAPDAVIFTSANGVSASGQFGLPQGLNAWCVGPKTAKLAHDAGFDPIVGPGDADGLVADVIAARPKGKLAHIRGMHARGDISIRLNAAGITCADVVAYDQKALALTPEAKSTIAAQNTVIFPLFSPRSATILNDKGPFVAPTLVIALSEAVKSAVSPNISRQITVADRPDGSAMLAAVLEMLRAQIGRS